MCPTKIKKKDFGNHPIVSRLTGLAAVETLNLASNKLTAVGPGMWTGLDSLKHLDLSFNQIARYTVWELNPMQKF